MTADIRKPDGARITLREFDYLLRKAQTQEEFNAAFSFYRGDIRQDSEAMELLLYGPPKPAAIISEIRDLCGTLISGDDWSKLIKQAHTTEEIRAAVAMLPTDDDAPALDLGMLMACFTSCLTDVPEQ